MFSTIPDKILRPKHIHPNVSSSDDYMREQYKSIGQKAHAFPHLNWRQPFVHSEVVPFKVSDGHWQVVCECGNHPAYDPEWELACCFTCGAIYEQEPPDDWEEIERVLLNRPKQNNRHMLVGQTVEELKAENREHGDPD